MAQKNPDMAGEDRLLALLSDVRELETFLHELLEEVSSEKLRPGESLLPHIERLGLHVPDSMQGAEITWDPVREAATEREGSPPLVLVRPGHPEALGFTVGCIKIWNVRVCLECGWLWCRIVIKGRF